MHNLLPGSSSRRAPPARLRLFSLAMAAPPPPSPPSLPFFALTPINHPQPVMPEWTDAHLRYFSALSSSHNFYTPNGPRSGKNDIGFRTRVCIAGPNKRPCDLGAFGECFNAHHWQELMWFRAHTPCHFVFGKGQWRGDHLCGPRRKGYCLFLHEAGTPPTRALQQRAGGGAAAPPRSEVPDSYAALVPPRPVLRSAPAWSPRLPPASPPPAPRLTPVSLPPPPVPTQWDAEYRAYFLALKDAQRPFGGFKAPPFRVVVCRYAAFSRGGCSRAAFGECYHAHNWEECMFFAPGKPCPVVYVKGIWGSVDLCKLRSKGTCFFEHSEEEMSRMQQMGCAGAARGDVGAAGDDMEEGEIEAVGLRARSAHSRPGEGQMSPMSPGWGGAARCDDGVAAVDAMEEREIKGVGLRARSAPSRPSAPLTQQPSPAGSHVTPELRSGSAAPPSFPPVMPAALPPAPRLTPVSEPRPPVPVWDAEYRAYFPALRDSFPFRGKQAFVSRQKFCTRPCREEVKRRGSCVGDVFGNCHFSHHWETLFWFTEFGDGDGKGLGLRARSQSVGAGPSGPPTYPSATNPHPAITPSSVEGVALGQRGDADATESTAGSMNLDDWRKIEKLCLAAGGPTALAFKMARDAMLSPSSAAEFRNLERQETEEICGLPAFDSSLNSLHANLSSADQFALNNAACTMRTMLNPFHQVECGDFSNLNAQVGDVVQRVEKTKAPLCPPASIPGVVNGRAHIYIARPYGSGGEIRDISDPSLIVEPIVGAKKIRLHAKSVAADPTFLELNSVTCPALRNGLERSSE